MSRFAKKKITIDEKVEVSVDGNKRVKAKGEKGENYFDLPSEVKAVIADGKIGFVFEENSGAQNTAKIGLSFRKVQNLITGVREGFDKILEMNGVGYRWSVANDMLKLQLGFSHDINYKIPQGAKITIDGNSLKVSGVDKTLVGLVASKIRSFRPVEPYKGKGIKYKDEYVIRKVGKASK